MAIFDGRERVFTRHRTRGERTSLNVDTFISLIFAPWHEKSLFLVVSECIPVYFLFFLHPLIDRLGTNDPAFSEVLNRDYNIAIGEFSIPPQ